MKLFKDMSPEERQAHREERAQQQRERDARAVAHAKKNPVSNEERERLHKLVFGEDHQ